MAIHVDSLPPRLDDAPRRPSPLIGAVVFMICFVAGSTTALLLWPKRYPTATPVFWVAVAIVPLLLSALAALVPWLFYAGTKRSIQAWNDRRDRFVSGVFERESQPIALLGCVCRIPVEEDHAIAKLAAGEHRLAPQQTPDKGAAIAARWFPAPAFSIEMDPREYDAERQCALLPSLLRSMLGTLKPRINALPPALPLNVALFVDAPLFEEALPPCMQSIWDGLGLRAFSFSTEPTVPNQMALDAWLDSHDDSSGEHATLLVIVQLHALVSQPPPAGSTEVAVALLMTPREVAQRHRLTELAHIHRPRQGAIAALQQALSLALKWGGAPPADIHHLWHAGFDKVGQQALLSAVHTENIPLSDGRPVSGEHDIDRLVGDAGIAADWFALACASEFAQSYGGPQLVARHDGIHSMLTVVRPVLRSPVQSRL
ncbi:hypothetical protein ACGTRS_11180 [Burkholderia semiarida]|uniref:Type VI secretion protein n=1 Tax=Burkholderia semiarida TaxID=2843303 RepID=A0ABW7L4C2_9BURK|nr:hypothetical protein [Burkholderia anthina]KWH63616.1 hypothetical protein WT63_01565 [Burkholderia anthina]